VAGVLSTGLLVGAVPAALGGAPAGAATPPGAIYRTAATLTGPVTVGHIIEPESARPTGLAADGYEEQEYFASGTAHAFRATSQPSDGKWTIVPTTSAPYRTRIIVRRPRDPARFDGTVVVEWLNVSSGESDPEWDFLNPALQREGDVYVGVSAQALGVDGGHSILGSPVAGSSTGLVGAEPARYGTLRHPGDQYSFDMFAQIGLALRARHTAVLGQLRPRHIVAVGESQSAFYLTTFVDALAVHTHAYDGFFLHSRAGGGASLAGGLTAGVIDQALRIRTDLHVPVFMFETQTDVIQLGYAAAQQPDTDRIRTWEVSGTSHADAYLVGPALPVLHCTTPVNDGPQHSVVQAAFTAFTAWVDHGTPPPSPPPFTLAGRHPATLALDGHGNVRGGVRTPAVDVPVSTLSGAPAPGSNTLCSFFGSTTAFSRHELVTLYHDQSGYLAAYTASLDRAIRSDYILGADRAGLLAQARAVPFPS
jgi:Alpha/beta hydrolase domain